MYGVSIYGSVAYGDSIFGTRIYASYADLIAEVNITLLYFTDLLAQTSITTVQFSDLPSKTQVAIETFSDLPALVSNAVLGFNDLYSQISIGELKFSDLISQVPIAELLSEDLLSNISVATIGFVDIPAEIPVAIKTFSDLLSNLSVSTKDFSDIHGVISVATEEFSDLFSKLSVSALEFVDIPGVIGVATETFSDLLTKLSVATIDFSDLPSQVTVPYFDFADLRAKISVAQELSNDLLCQIETAPMSDINAQVTISNYKWLSPTLYEAQQQPNVRYAFKTFIVDDSVVWNANLGTTTFPIFGDAVMAPDGSLLVIGTAKSGNWVDGNLYFKRITNPSDPTQWTTTGATQLVSNGDWVYHQYFNGKGTAIQPSISVSDWINGTYVIDIYYWNVINYRMYIKHKRSVDGGKSWFDGLEFNTNIDYLFNPAYIALAAGKPMLNHSNGNITATVFWVTGIDGIWGSNPGSTHDQIKFAYFSYVNSSGYSLSATGAWNTNYIDSYDWTIRGLDVFYKDDFYYIVFAGYHNRYEKNNKNYGLYLTKIKAPNGDLSYFGSAGSFAWSRIKEIITTNSSSVTNLASFTNPKLSFDGEKLYLLSVANVVQNINEMQNVKNDISYYLFESEDFENFSYPIFLSDANGNTFLDPMSITTISNPISYKFVPFGYGNGNDILGFPRVSNFYLCNNTTLWKYNKNNIVADVSDYVLGYNINETAGGPSSISIAIANADGQWYGVNPTMPNYEAIKKNSKIYLFQGYYTSKGEPEYAPKNVFYIDDIQQRITATQNDLVITGRDFHKNLKTTISKFTFNYNGSDFIIDNFDGSTIGNWSVQGGGVTWAEGTCPQSPVYNQTIYPIAPAPNSSVAGGVGTLISLSGLNISESDYFMAISVQIPTTGASEIYLNYIDQNNWIKLLLQATSPYWVIYQCSNGNIGVVSQYTSGYPLYPQWWYVVYIRKRNWFVYDVYIVTAGRTEPSQYFTYYEGDKISSFSFSTSYNPNGSLVQTIALGAVNGSQAAFARLFFAQYRQSNSIKDLIKKLSTKAKIYNCKLPYIYEGHFATDSDRWNLISNGLAISSIIGDKLLIKGDGTNWGMAYYNYQQFDNAEVEFKMKIENPQPTSNEEVYLFFRVQGNENNKDNSYACRLYSGFGDNNKNLKVDFMIYYGGSQYIMARGNILGTGFDITQEHTYRIGFNGNLMYVSVDDTMVLAWRDDKGFYSSGYIAFGTQLNERVKIWDVKISDKLFNQINSFSINPGDDIENSLVRVIENQRAWIMSDLAGRLKVVLPDKNDQVTYYYGDNAPNFLLLDCSIDESDKEYVNRVTVVGNNIVATAQDNKSVGSNSILREQVIVDYSITTLKAAQERANYELQHFNQMNTQPTPKLNNNVGSEIFDVINLKDTSNPNSSGYNSNARVYNQTITLNGQTMEYSITLGLGSV